MIKLTLIHEVSGCAECPAVYDEVIDSISSTSPCCALVVTGPVELHSSGFRELPPSDLGRAPAVAPKWCPLRASHVKLTLVEGA